MTDEPILDESGFSSGAGVVEPKPNKMREYLASPEFAEFSRQQQEADARYAADCEKYWDALSYDDKLMAFSSVVKRIVKGDLKDRGTYRYVLYDVFGFDMDSYGIGMQCGYMDLHNSVVNIDELEQLRLKVGELESLIETQQNGKENYK
jgi:hypothetical protein